MNNLQKEVASYLSKNYNYNPEKDVNAAQEAAKLDRMSNEYFNYKPMEFMKRSIVDNVDYKMLMPVFEIEGEKHFLLDFVYQWDVLDFYSERDYGKNVVAMLNSITPEQARELVEAGLDMSEFVNYLLFVLRPFPCVFDVLEFEHVDGSYGREPVTSRLKDPLYSFPEMDLVLRLKDVFGFTVNQIVDVINEEGYDYATYSVGDYNSDLRDEQMIYFNDHLKPYLLGDREDMEVNDKIELLRSYLRLIDDIESELFVLGLAKGNPEIGDIEKRVIFSKRSVQTKRLRDIPSKYLNNHEYQMVPDTYPKTRALLEKRIEKLLKEGK